MKAAHQRQVDRRGHDQFAARVLEYATAERFLFDRAVGEVQRLGRQRCGHARRAGAHDEHVQALARGALVLLLDGFNGLDALNQRVAYQAHAAQFAGNKHARHVGLKIRMQHRQVDAARLGAKHQRDGIDRTG